MPLRSLRAERDSVTEPEKGSGLFFARSGRSGWLPHGRKKRPDPTPVRREGCNSRTRQAWANEPEASATDRVTQESPAESDEVLIRTEPNTGVITIRRPSALKSFRR